jgi:hypothetical protein
MHLTDFEFALVEATSKPADEQYYPEETLLVEENDIRLMRDFLVTFYENVSEVPHLYEIVEEVNEYNSEVIHEMGDYELQANCLMCSEKDQCWPSGVPDPDVIWETECSQPDKMDQCYSDFFEITCNYTEYNYPGYYAGEELILAAVGELGYAVILDHNDLDYVFENAFGNKAVYYDGIHEMYFNDAQQVLIPAFAYGAWEPRYLAMKHPLLTTT